MQNTLKINPATCQHTSMDARVHVVEVKDKTDKEGNPLFVAEMRLKCKQCFTPFRFLGVNAGPGFEKPEVSTLGATEIQLPVVACKEDKIDVSKIIEDVFCKSEKQSSTPEAPNAPTT